MATAVVLVCRVSAACGPYGTYPGFAAPKHGGVVPKNIPAVVVAPSWDMSSVCTLADVELRNAAGELLSLVPSDKEQLAYLLGDELDSGSSYELSFTDSCAQGGGQAGTQQHVFSVGPAAPLPSHTGKLTVLAAGKGTYSISQGSCSFSGQGAWVEVALVPTCELVPFLEVTRFVAELDGKELWAESGFGTMSGPSNSPGGKRVGLVYAGCGSEQPGPPLYPTKPGKRLLSIRAHVAGAAVDPEPASLEIDLGCTADANSSPPAPAPNGGLDLASACGGEGAGPAPSSTAAAPAGGCTHAQATRTHAGSALVLLAAALLLARRRRWS